jgi:hypothetical protein
VPGRITVSASSVAGTSRDSKTNNRRSALLNTGLFGDLRLSTLIWWRRTRISASRRALERNSPMSAPQNNLSSWIIGREHHPIRAGSPGTEFPTRTGIAGSSKRRFSPGTRTTQSANVWPPSRGSGRSSPRRGGLMQRWPCYPYRPERVALSTPPVSRFAQGQTDFAFPRRFRRCRPKASLRLRIARTDLLSTFGTPSMRPDTTRCQPAFLGTGRLVKTAHLTAWP